MSEEKKKDGPAKYPMFLYHPDKGELLVESEEEAKELGKGWFESPADFPSAKKGKKEE